MFLLKSCPRFSGGLYVDQDQYGSFVSCMQCGLNREICSQPGEPLRIASAASLPAPLPQWQGAGTKRRRISHGGRHFAQTFTFGEESRTQSVA